MAKLSCDEFNKKYSEKIVDNDDLLIELMEDASDSFGVNNEEELTNLRNEIETTKSELEKARMEMSDLKDKYKQRFLQAVKNEEPKNIEPDMQEKEVIDIKEI